MALLLNLFFELLVFHDVTEVIEGEPFGFSFIFLFLSF